jgi:anti-sigma factor RsiW
MTDKTTGIDELDLLAYADGRLDAARAAEVESYLAERPELARQVEDFAQQDRELHAQFDRYLERPMPDRIARLFEEPPPRRQASGRRVVQHALAASLLMAMTGAGGWWLGHGMTSTSPETERFVAQAMQRFVSADLAAQGEANGLQTVAGGDATLTRFSDRISIELRAPDLSAHGYRLIGKERVAFDGEQGVVLRYAGEREAEVHVFLKSRWQGDSPGFETVESDHVTLTYWNDGPLAVAVAASQSDSDSVGTLAREVHDALGRGGEEPGAIPKVTPYGESQGARQEAGVAPDGSAGTTPEVRGSDQM